MEKESCVHWFGRGPSFILTSEPFLGTLPFRYTERLEITFDMTLSGKEYRRVKWWCFQLYYCCYYLLKKDADRFIIVTALIANNFEKKFGRQKKRKKNFQETGPKSKCVCECGVCYAKGRRRHPRFLRIECVRNATLGRLTHTAKGIEPFSPLRECLNARTGQASPGVCDPDRTFEFPKAKKKRRKEREVKKKKKKEETLHGV